MQINTNEIINKSGSGSGAAQRELVRLVRSGLVNAWFSISGNMAFVSPTLCFIHAGFVEKDFCSFHALPTIIFSDPVS